jgi:2-succinyl-6-hydroxy-2,4-cyclohexadiene-1-carboxylate synthase
VTRLAVRDIELNVEVKGTGTGPGLLLLHGFTGDMSTWQPFLNEWSGFTKILVDIIGHGQSEAPPFPERYSMARAAKDLVELLDQLAFDAVAVVGYSMGGRLALHLALEAPERFWALVLESASPGIADAKERYARVESDHALADGIERDGIEAFVDRWQAQPLFASQSRLPADVFERQRQQRLASPPHGLANSLRGMGTGRQEYLLPRLGELMMPVLLLAGALDERYTALAGEMAFSMADATVEIIADAGHAAHLEQPERFSAAVLQFLRAHRPALD